MSFDELKLAIKNGDLKACSGMLAPENPTILIMMWEDIICYDRLEEAYDLIKLMKANDPDSVKDLVARCINCSKGGASKSMLKLAIDSGGDINKKSVTNKTALMKYLWDVDEDNVNLLLKYIEDLNIQDNQGNTAIFYLQESWPHENFNKYIKYFKEMKKKGADIYHKNNYGDTVLHYTGNDVESIKFLLEQGLNVDSQNMNGDTPLINALLNNQTKAAISFIDGGADIELANYNNESPLSICKKSKGLKSVKNKLKKLGYSFDETNITNIQDYIEVSENVYEKIAAYEKLLNEHGLKTNNEIHRELKNNKSLKTLVEKTLDINVDFETPDGLDAFQILSLLVPAHVFYCPAEPFGAYEQAELITVYTDIFSEINRVIEKKYKLKDIKGEIINDVTKINFAFLDGTFEFDYEHSSSYIDTSVFSDIENFGKEHLSGRFLINYEEECSIPIAYLPIKVHEILQKTIIHN